MTAALENNQVVINDVGPRDGLQNQKRILSVEQRLELIKALAAANVKHIEVGAFVSPKAVPAMAGADQIVKSLDGVPGEFSVLIPNLRGYELAVDAGAKSVAMVLYASDGMAEKNVGMSRQQADDAAFAILERAGLDQVDVNATISVAFQCPFDGPTDPKIVQDICEKFMSVNVAQVVIADTIGAADPMQASSLMTELVSKHGADRLACHFHDTRALGMANVYAAVEAGVRRFDASIAGLGGCPFAPGATGNIATEDAVMMLHQMGYETGIDINKLMAVSDLAEQLTGSAPGGRSKPWLRNYLNKQSA